VVNTDERTGKQAIFVHSFDPFKGMTMTVVCIAILAVDFPPIFSRSLCKTEEFGISLMDTGVALITLNAGITASKSRPWWRAQNKMSLMRELTVSLPNILTTFIFGFARLFVMSNLDYQGHASEWGIHWNFYTTISICLIVGIFLRDSHYAGLYAMLIALAYQVYCHKANLSEYMFYAERTDFISANREGLYSLVGYISLQFMGYGIGYCLLSNILDPSHL
jgi:phosphatidylinositol glycan class W